MQTTEGGFFSNLADPHRKIEHWGTRLAIVLVLMSVSVGYSEVHHHNQVVRQEMTVNPSGTSVQFSKAKAIFTLKKAVLSNDGKWAYIPFTISNMTYLPNDPSQYQILIQAKGNKHSSLAYKPVMRLVLFGSSGKGAIAMYSSTGIQNQPINLYLINLKRLAKADTQVQDTAGDTASGSQTDSGMQALQNKYDLIMFSANPGATDVRKAKRTDASLDDKETLYMSLFGGKSTKGIMNSISRAKQSINDNKEMIDEDRSKLTQMGFKVPKDPAWMADNWRPFDVVNAETGKTKTGKDAITYVNENGSEDMTHDKDDESFPDTLPSTSDIKMDEQSDSQGRQASALWQDLCDRWNSVHSKKRQIWVNDQAKLYQINQQRHRQKTMTTIGPSAKNVAISRIKVRTIKEWLNGFCKDVKEAGRFIEQGAWRWREVWWDWHRNWYDEQCN